LEGVLFDRKGRYLYGYIGLEDRMMEPLLLPGSLVLVDPARRQVKNSGWKNEFERPIYFVDLRQGYRCAWCVQEPKTLILQPHSLSPCTPKIFSYPGEGEVVGQVIEVVTRLIGL
jgi:hypothetical protein